MDLTENIPATLSRIEAEISKIKKLLITGAIQPKNKLLTLPEAAEFLNISKPTIYRFVSAKTIPFHKQGRLYFFEAELLEWVKSGREKNLPGHGKL